MRFALSMTPGLKGGTYDADSGYVPYINYKKVAIIVSVIALTVVGSLRLTASDAYRLTIPSFSLGTKSAQATAQPQDSPASNPNNPSLNWTSIGNATSTNPWSSFNKSTSSGATPATSASAAQTQAPSSSSAPSNPVIGGMGSGAIIETPITPTVPDTTTPTTPVENPTPVDPTPVDPPIIIIDPPVITIDPLVSVDLPNISL